MFSETEGCMKKLFSNESVNSGRQVELDLAKCFAILFMILLHCLMVSSGFANDISSSMQRGIGQLLGAPFSAPVFMFTMGVGTVYSRNQDPNPGFFDAIVIIILTYVSNCDIL
jgi:uncharacterized membrane protein